MLAAYVSGHGFGHATRTGEVLRALRRREPGLAVSVVSSAPEALFRAALSGPFEFRRVECDVGLAQRDALRIDEAGTAAACRAFARGWDEHVLREAEWLRGAGAGLSAMRGFWIHGRCHPGREEKEKTSAPNRRLRKSSVLIRTTDR